MKKFILIALASLSIISCRKDDEKEESLILGTWNLTKIQIMSGKDNSVLSSEIISDCPDKMTYLFSDNRYTLTIFKDNFIGSCVVDETENGEFNYNENQREVTFKSTLTGNPYIIKINSITNNELQLIDSYFGYDANNDGVIDKRVMVFSK
ncbi:lipocalin family protein [Chryseobacterium sp. KACC 21268]|nr:lipocalin family protein [Chryseobacterium sp. KACC 21268]